MKLIQFSAESGSTEAGNRIRPIKNKLNKLFFCNESELPSYQSLDGLSIVFRMSGKNKKFSGDGPQLMQKSRQRNFYTIDLVIPEEKWKTDAEVFIKNLVEGINECSALLFEEIERIGEIDDSHKLKVDHASLIDKFTKEVASDLS